MFDEFNRKQSDAAQEAGNLLIILAQGATIEDEWNDPPQFPPHIEPKLRAFFMSPVEGLISLCDLDLSIDRGISQFFKRVHVIPNTLAQLLVTYLQTFHSNHSASYIVILTALAVLRLPQGGFHLVN